MIFILITSFAWVYFIIFRRWSDFGLVFLFVCVASFGFFVVVVVVVWVSATSSSSSVASSLACVSLLVLSLTIAIFIIVLIIILGILILFSTLLLFSLPFLLLLLILLSAFLITILVIILFIFRIGWTFLVELWFLLYFSFLVLSNVCGFLFLHIRGCVFVWLLIYYRLGFSFSHWHKFNLIFSIVFFMCFMRGSNTPSPFHIAITFHQMQLLYFWIVLTTSIWRILLLFIIILKHRPFLIIN